MENNDLIKRSDLNDKLDELCVNDAVYDSLQAIPTVDAVPVVHGRWIRLKNEKGKLFPWYQCSKCGCSPAYWENELPPYCHCCGANMKGADKQNASNT